MRAILSIEKLQETKTYRDLEADNDLINIAWIKSRHVRAVIYTAYLECKNVGGQPDNFTGLKRAVIIDLLELDKPDASNRIG